MRVFVYELLTGGAFPLREVPPPPSLLAEGRAMLTALATDFAALLGVEVAVLRDPRCGPLDLPPVVETQVVLQTSLEAPAFDGQAVQADWTVVIAPETDGELLRRCRRVLELGGRLLGPGPDLVELASDKHGTAEHLLAQGVAAPRGIALAVGQRLPGDFPLPAVMKPRDGAGSQGMCLLDDSQWANASTRPVSGPTRLESFCPGLAASVALLCGPPECIPLPACRQVLSDDGRFAYVGGQLPLAPSLDARARRLAQRAVATLPSPLGYIGVDLVLGDDASGTGDRVIEINPRLTTSYVGLRAAARCNLAEAMLQLAVGQSPSLEFDQRPLRFWADGTIEPSAAD